VYGFPKVFNPTHLLLNVDAAEESGVGVPGDEWTLSEFELFLQKVGRTGPDGSVTRYGMTGLNTFAPADAGWLYLHGGSPFDEVTGEPTLTDSRLIRILDW